MAKGRKRKPGNREPSGKLSRRAADRQTMRSIDEQEAMHVVKEARQRVFGVSTADCATELAGSVCGRLLLQKRLTREQVDAAVAFAEIYSTYARVMHSPRQPKAVAMGLASGGGGRDITPEQHTRAKQRWDAACKAIQEANFVHRSGSLHAACDYLVLRDELHEHMLGDLRLALNALARHFGVDGHRQAA